MDEGYHIERADEPAWEIIGGGLRDFNNRQAGDGHGKNLCFVLRASDQSIVGGVIGETHWNWLFVNLMWVKDELRGQGYGHQLLAMAEAEARLRGATDAYLDTFSFQAPDFYKKNGYQVFGTLENFPPGHQRYYFTKKL
jgi:GNAT superfamily N-acetyltransferase